MLFKCDTEIFKCLYKVFYYNFLWVSVQTWYLVKFVIIYNVVIKCFRVFYFILFYFMGFIIYVVSYNMIVKVFFLFWVL